MGRPGGPGSGGLQHLPDQSDDQPVRGPVGGHQRGGVPGPGRRAARQRKPERPHRHDPGPGQRSGHDAVRDHDGPAAAGVDLLPHRRHRSGHRVPAHLLSGHACQSGVQLRRGHPPGPGGHPAAPVLPHLRRGGQRPPQPVLCHRLPAGRGRSGSGHHHRPVHLCRTGRALPDERTGAPPPGAEKAGPDKKGGPPNFKGGPACRLSGHGVLPVQRSDSVLPQFLRRPGAGRRLRRLGQH